MAVIIPQQKNTRSGEEGGGKKGQRLAVGVRGGRTWRQQRPKIVQKARPLDSTLVRKTAGGGGKARHRLARRKRDIPQKTKRGKGGKKKKERRSKARARKRQRVG